MAAETKIKKGKKSVLGSVKFLFIPLLFLVGSNSVEPVQLVSAL